MGAPSAARRGVLHGWSFLVDGMAALGTVLIGVLMAVICADVVARNLMGASLPLVSEFGALLLVMIVYLQLATTLRHDRMPRSDFLLIALDKALPLPGRIIRGVFDLITALSLGVIAWSTLGILSKDLSAGAFIGVTGVATVPVWPFRAIILAAMTVACIQALLQAATGTENNEGEAVE